MCDRGALRLGSIVAAMVLLAACTGDMYDQPKAKPLGASTFWPDGRASRTPPEGTVARGQLDADPAVYTGRVEGRLVARIPVAVTPQLLARGRERFDIYCSVCHGRVGDGNGMIPSRGFQRPPSYHDERLLTAPAGHFFDVITNGYGAMRPYADRVTVPDRWAIVAYIRALQLSQHAPASALAAGRPGDTR